MLRRFLPDTPWLAAGLFIYRKKLDIVFNKYCHSDEYIKDLKKEAKLFGKLKNDD